MPALVQSGQISAQTLMWRDGMPQWMPAASVFPLLFSASTATTQPLVAGSPSLGGSETATMAPTAAAPTSGRAASGASLDSAVRRFAAPLFERKGWMKFLGVMLIINGILALPAFLLGLILIFSGVALFKAAGNVERAHATGDAAALEEASRNAAKSVFFAGLYMAIGLVFTALIFAVMALGFGAAIFSGIQGGALNQPGGPDGPARYEEIRFPDSPPPANQDQ